MLCFVLATLGLLRCLAAGSRRTWVGTTLAAGAAMLSHPEIGAATVVTLPLVAWFAADGRDGRVRRSAAALAVLAGAAVVASPWWVTVLVRFGFQPFVAAAGSTQGSLLDMLRWLAVFPATAEPGLAVLATLGVLGTLGLAVTGRPLPLLWLLALIVAIPRNSATPITVPLALGVGACLDGLAAAFERVGARGPLAARAPVVVLAGWALGYAVLGNRILLGGADATLPALDREERELAAWVSEHTPPDSRFLIVTSAAEGEPDPFSEWFPALAQRVSVLTPQGLEWTGGYGARAALAVRFTRCVPEGVTCLDRLADSLPPHTHVVVGKSARGSHDLSRIFSGLLRSPAFEPVFDSPAGTVFLRRS
jgi:hypothetical protein